MLFIQIDVSKLAMTLSSLYFSGREEFKDLASEFSEDELNTSGNSA